MLYYTTLYYTIRYYATLYYTILYYTTAPPGTIMPHRTGTSSASMWLIFVADGTTHLYQHVYNTSNPAVVANTLFGIHLKGATCSSRVSKEILGPMQPKKPWGPSCCKHMLLSTYAYYKPCVISTPGHYRHLGMVRTHVFDARKWVLQACATRHRRDARPAQVNIATEGCAITTISYNVYATLYKILSSKLKIYYLYSIIYNDHTY